MKTGKHHFESFVYLACVDLAPWYLCRLKIRELRKFEEKMFCVTYC